MMTRTNKWGRPLRASETEDRDTTPPPADNAPPRAMTREEKEKLLRDYYEGLGDTGSREDYYY